MTHTVVVPDPYKGVPTKRLCLKHSKLSRSMRLVPNQYLPTTETSQEDQCKTVNEGERQIRLLYGAHTYPIKEGQ